MTSAAEVKTVYGNIQMGLLLLLLSKSFESNTIVVAIGYTHRWLT